MLERHAAATDEGQPALELGIDVGEAPFAQHSDSAHAEAIGGQLEVTPPSRLVWTHEEAGGNGQITTATFEERAGQTLLVMHDLYPSAEALDEAIASGSTSGIDETFKQLDALLASTTSLQ